MSPWLKAGLIGAAVVILFYVFSLFVPCFLCMPFVVYIAVGILAAYWIPPIREAGQGAAQGAGAAVLAAFVGGIVNSIITTVSWAATDPTEVLAFFPDSMLMQWQEAGIDPAMFMSPSWGILAGSLCCIIGLIFAAILGAVGGAVFAGIKAD